MLIIVVDWNIAVEELCTNSHFLYSVLYSTISGGSEQNHGGGNNMWPDI